jgi:Flp pilus assembly protein TadG
MLKRCAAKPPGALPRLRLDRRSTAAMEFAITAPVLVTIILGAYEICNATIIYEEVQNAAHSIPASASNLAVYQNDTGATALTYQQIQLTASEIWAQIPELRTGLQNGAVSVTITSVTFIPTLPPTPPAAQTQKPASACNPSKTVHCAYTPTVIWSVAYTGGASGRTFSTALRSCSGAPTAASQANAKQYSATAAAYVSLPGGLNSEAPQSTNTAAATAPTWSDADLSSLPSYFVANPDPFWAAPSPIIVVDVHLKYTSVLGLFLRAGVDFYGSGFFPVRSVEAATAGAGGTTALSLPQQFTTIVEDSTNESLTGAPSSTYCVNSSNGLSPPAES